MRRIAFALACLWPAMLAASPLGDAFAPAIAATRAQAGLGALQEDPRLSRAAQAYAEAMAASGRFDHVGADGSTQVTRARAAGCRTTFVGEDIAWGQATAQDAFSGWMGSAGHRANFLGSGYRLFGVGGSGGMWVILFADRC